MQNLLLRSLSLVAVAIVAAGRTFRCQDSHPRPAENRIYRFEPRALAVEDFEVKGPILDVGGGGEGIIGFRTLIFLFSAAVSAERMQPYTMLSLLPLVRILLFAGVAVLGVQLVAMVVRGRSVNVAGSPTIYAPLFYLAKTGLVISFACLVWAGFARDAVSPLRAGLFLALFLPGCSILSAAFHRLGANLRMGLPGEETALVTSGIYGVSRNPIYLAMFFLMGASLIYAFSWLNLAAVAVSAALHDRIARAEERFLASHFADYAAYRKRVRRYL
jgi:protein-S-isoprenylcysteine O-methyltransferase Ste14